MIKTREIIVTVTRTAKSAKPIQDVVKDAKTLGVNRWHLARCIRGERKSERLMKRYHELKQQQAEQENFRAARVTANAPGVTTGVSGSPGLKEAASR